MDVVAVENVGDRAAYYVKSTARTNKTVDAFYKVRDVNETWIDTESICSLKSSQQMREGHYQSDKVTENNHAAGTFAFKKRNRGWWHGSAGALPQFSQDILSALYYLRTLPIEAGRSYEMSVVSGGETWPLVVHVRGVETVSVAAGRFECWRLEPVLKGEGLFLQSGNMEVWVTRDARKIPVLMRSRVAVGAFDAEMTEYKGGL
jgi:hypothetical protein